MRSGCPGAGTEVRDLRAREEGRRRVRAGGHARATADAGGRLHRLVRVRLGYEDRVRLGRAARARRDVPARRDDSVEGGAIDDEVAQHRERRRAPRLEPQVVAVLEVPHVQLAHGRVAKRAVRLPVDEEAAHAADALAAVRVERDGLLALRHEPLVQHVQHLEEGHVADVRQLVPLEVAGSRGFF
jgi:hypothetical protein